MDFDFSLSENSNHSFIIKIWSDESPSDKQTSINWHGQATNVVTGEQFEFEELEQLKKFLFKSL